MNSSDMKHAKKIVTCAVLASAILMAILPSLVVKNVSCVSPLDSAENVYDMDGIYRGGDQTLTLSDVEIRVLITDAQEVDREIAMMYRVLNEMHSVLPYGVDENLLVLWYWQAGNNTVQEKTLFAREEDDFSRIWYGLDIYTATLDHPASGNILECKWDKNQLFLYEMVIRQPDDRVNKLVISLVSTTTDIYDGYSVEDVTFIKAVLFFTSVQGIVFLSIFGVVLFVLIYVTARYMKQKLRRHVKVKDVVYQKERLKRRYRGGYRAAMHRRTRR